MSALVAVALVWGDGGAALASPHVAPTGTVAPSGSGTRARPLIPLPADEAAFYARMDEALAPVLQLRADPAVLERLREADRAVQQADIARAREIEAQLTDRVAAKLVRWMLLRHDSVPATAAEIEAFRKANTDFPQQALLRQRAEEALLLKQSDGRAILDFFASSPPETGAGLVAIAAAYLGLGQRDKAAEAAGKAWRDHDLGARVEQVLLATVGGLLTEADHLRRIDRILMAHRRWKGERAEHAARVRRVMPYLSAEKQKTIEARIAVYLGKKDAGRLLAALPAQARKDWGVYFAMIQHARRSGRDAEEDDNPQEPGADVTQMQEAWRLLLAAPTDAAKVVSPDDWWIERRTNAYGALATGQVKIAYDMVKAPGPLTVNAMNDAQRTAGWIALRKLKDAKAALNHFSAMAKTADGPISHSTAQYWLGRAYTALGDTERARAHYRKAVPYFDTFYGQLARQTLEPETRHLRVAPPAEPTAEQARGFAARDGVRAAMLARQAGLSATWRLFLAHLRYRLLDNPAEIALVAHLSERLGDTQSSLRTGKAALTRQYPLGYYAFPTQAFPNYQPLRPPPETAMLMAIARQESEFNTMTRSGAGATGVLQVMPVTARHVCRDYKMTCQLSRLATDPAYNATIASAYIGDRMAEFAGSYVLTLAGYNAGPGRARQWIREFGDPRDPGVDPVDWIERIPFEETRDYVKKVLANVQVYRARIGNEKEALQVIGDLYRASTGPPSLPDGTMGARAAASRR